MINPNIIYGNKVKFQGRIGLVKGVSGSVAQVLFLGNNKPTNVHVDDLEKVDD